MEQTEFIFTDKIFVADNNMRQHIDRDEIFELSEDIKKNGLISPITVRPVGEKFELVAGQRRYLAHQFAGILKIKCIVRNLTNDEVLSIQTSENLARVDVNPVDEAKHIGRLMKMYNDDIEKVKHIVGRSEAWVRDRIAVADMPDYLQEFLAKKEIKLGVALILNKISDESYRKMWVLQAVRDGVNVAMAESWLAYFKTLLLPGGLLAENVTMETVPSAPQIIPFTCALDGQQYDIRHCKSLMIYEGNVEFFNAFVSAFRNPPSETELELGGN